jgi:hypothetical protein
MKHKDKALKTIGMGSELAGCSSGREQVEVQGSAVVLGKEARSWCKEQYLESQGFLKSVL